MSFTTPVYIRAPYTFPSRHYETASNALGPMMFTRSLAHWPSQMIRTGDRRLGYGLFALAGIWALEPSQELETSALAEGGGAWADASAQCFRLIP